MTEIEREFVDEIDSYNSEPRMDLSTDERKEIYLAEVKNILDQFTEFEYDIQPEGVVIKFPDYICRDSYGNTTPIYNAFVRVGVNKSVKLRRTKFTQIQYYSNYIHSHVSNNAVKSEWTDRICYGSNIITQNSFLETLITVLAFYPTFLKEESSMTNPHKRIGSLGIGGDEVYNPADIQDYSSFINYLQIKIRNLYGLQLLSVMFKDEAAFNNALMEAGGFAYNVDGRFYRGISISNDPETILPNRFTFKGENQPLYIVRDDWQMPEKVVCQKTKQDILNKINILINEPSFFQ